jgi:hypothetical protein
MRVGTYEALLPSLLCAVPLIVVCLTAATAVGTDPAFSLDRIAVSPAMSAGGFRLWPPTAADAIGIGDQSDDDDDVADDGSDASFGLDDHLACEGSIAVVGVHHPAAEIAKILPLDARVHSTRAPPRNSPRA